ncbi:GEVED domain-containing protein [Aequorivita sp. KMM 9714]|uniref:GEVED domain-containing protein n=1 Tax=Aequorivita sp. KMM 9714 TaxID=2707173 RepID=UPI0013EB3432|nr:GEVED domain-containing protein [Aequorivita sp. KMM 9714]NGX84282.1 T9SS type A sorting domain-containing protein [Aequorivita sp. KMM 9714]
MRKLTLLAFLSVCSIGFAQNRVQNQSKVIKNTTVELPAAYYNSTVPAIAENNGAVSSDQRSSNIAVPYTGTHYSNLSPNDILYYNGPYWNTAGNPNSSLLESVTLGMNTLGSSAKLTDGTSIADDVIFAEDVEISSIDVFAYQTGSTAPSVTAVYVRVWDADPSAGGANIVWGDLTTNIIDVATYADANRTTETEPNDTSRQIQRVKALTPGLSLSAGTYWIEYTFEGSGSSGPWAPPIVILGEPTTGNALQNQSGSWVSILDSGTSTPQGFPFVIYGDIVGGGSFPAPYCEVSNITVEPITLVEVATISHRSSEVVDGSPSHENFTAITGIMKEEQSYSIALEGNTNGDYPNSFTVFIDWDQDGVLDNDDERYEIGVIQNSTGTDGIQATGTITVPAGVTPGPTRMRVHKQFGSEYTVDSCTTSAWGQVEDYTINVDILSFPDPYCGPLEYNLDIEPITLVEVAGISNRTDNTINGSPGHEDFTSIVGEMTEGETYVVALEGNTGGYDNSFTIFIDWNQDGILDNEGERYDIGVISESNGNDGIQTVGSIAVPVGATAGNTRMRVIKRFTSSGSDYPIDSCTPGSNYGQAEDYTINVTAGSFPDPYCGPIEYLYAVEPITLVEVAGISNRTDNTVDGSPGHEDFTSIVGNMTEGETYPIALEGHTGGFISSFTVFIDWNQDGVLDNDSERYEIGAISNSNGNDGQQATGDIVVPMGVTAGATRMRVIKRFTSTANDYAIDSCNPGSNYGQTEDYTIEVGLLGVNENSLVGFSFYPNPTSDMLSLNSANNIESVTIYNMLGQKVLSTNIDATTSEISLAGLNTGTYILEVTVKGQIGTYRVIKN